MRFHLRTLFMGVSLINGFQDNHSYAIAEVISAGAFG
jgi:hypothetical protein